MAVRAGYALGVLILSAGVALAAYLLNVPLTLIAAGLVLVGVSLVAVLRANHRDPPHS